MNNQLWRFKYLGKNEVFKLDHLTSNEPTIAAIGCFVCSTEYYIPIRTNMFLLNKKQNAGEGDSLP